MSYKERNESPAGSPRLDASFEETLPLYQELQHTDAAEDVPPSASATPDEVRDFITRLLINRRGLPQDYIRRAVAKWTIGSGQELRSYSPSMYLDIFGREDGWIIYREVKLCIYREQNKSFSSRFAIYIFAAIMALLEMVFVTVAINASSEGVLFFGVMTSFVGGMICFGAAIGCCVHAGRNNESLVESELRACTKSTPTTQG